MYKILIAEDEQIMQDLFTTIFRIDDYQLTITANADEAIAAMTTTKFNLIITDLLMPGADGYKLLEHLKANDNNIPILVISALSDEAGILKSYQYGAIDYVVKPINPQILMMKVSKILGLTSDYSQKIELNRNKYEVKLSGDCIKLTSTEYEILSLLVHNPGVIYSKYDLINEIWYENYEMSEKIVEVNIFNLRKKLGNHRAIIKTYRNRGYAYEEN